MTVLIKDTDASHVHREKARWENSKKGATCKPTGEVSEKSSLGLLAPDCETSTSLWNHLVHWNFFFYSLCCIGVQLINNAVIVLGGQQRDSAIRKHVSILPQIPLPPRLPHNTEQSSLLYPYAIQEVSLCYFVMAANQAKTIFWILFSINKLVLKQANKNIWAKHHFIKILETWSLEF